jgi:DNA-directed RNA polymerase subunit RPC12/RpoP
LDNLWGVIFMVISGVYRCHNCGQEKDFGEKFPLPQAPFKIPCEQCGTPLIESVPEEAMEEWAAQIEASLTPQEKALIRGETPPQA